MRLELDSSSRAFIDLAKTGRRGWQAAVLTILLVVLLSVLGTSLMLTFTGWSIYLKHVHLADVGTTVVSGAANPLVCIFGLWLACKIILKRPFLSLVSTDLTFSVRRCFVGAALYLPANLLGIAAMSLYISTRYGAWTIPLDHFERPAASAIFAAVVAIIAIPFLAFAEELFFRGWLTQTIGQHVRMPALAAALVAILFAAFHTQYDLKIKTLMLATSLGLSALCLRDQRLELAIGAHSTMNICVVLKLLLFTGPVHHMQVATTITTYDWISLAILKGALPLGAMYGVLQITGGWFSPTEPLPAKLPASG
ncbi:hypothetical protein GQ56_0127340 [Burkholderia paludis]|uniref:CPBP family glutamic-type intramembrane protease n=1 Tax=Burkholderia paludis TaxID=1506587 RepID=UPI0004DB6FFE|nr:CPBP family glutamic-type intramembrane protease [Burkholderia paludis]KFG94226.1 hypothetical protein GQ56_0127340 [Burkholderia paludis]